MTEMDRIFFSLSPFLFIANGQDVRYTVPDELRNLPFIVSIRGIAETPGPPIRGRLRITVIRNNVQFVYRILLTPQGNVSFPLVGDEFRIEFWNLPGFVPCFGTYQIDIRPYTAMRPLNVSNVLGQHLSIGVVGTAAPYAFPPGTFLETQQLSESAEELTLETTSLGLLGVGWQIILYGSQGLGAVPFDGCFILGQLAAAVNTARRFLRVDIRAMTLQQVYIQTIGIPVGTTINVAILETLRLLP
jgi:hypothetical protein